MARNELVNIYIESTKAFYYPGEQFVASILLDVLDKVKCNKMTITAKGKQIINAAQKQYDNQSEETKNDDSEEEEEEEQGQDVIQKKKQQQIIDIKGIKTIFKYKKEVQISNNDFLVKGKYIFPFELGLPDDIPGSFLFLEKQAYAEIIYSIKVKLNNINIKERIPIVIRQKEETFKYKETSEYSKKLGGCCCEKGETKIKIKNNEPFTLNGNPIKISVNIDNRHSGWTGSPISVEVYQKLVLKNKNKKIKVTKIVGKFKGSKIINARENYNRHASITLDSCDYTTEHLSECKSIKYYKHKSIIPLLNQSIKSENISNQYEIYAESQFANLTADELGVFIMIIIYPPEKGIISKNVSNISKEFSNSIINNKKIFLNDEAKYRDNEFDKSKKSSKYNKKDDDSQSMYSNKEIFSKKIVEKNDEDDRKEVNNIKNTTRINFNNIENDNNNIFESQRYKNALATKKSCINSEEISFGTSTKDRANLFVADTMSNNNNIKKNFNQTFLNDALDDDFLDIDSNK